MTHAGTVQAGPGRADATASPDEARPDGPARLSADPGWFVDLGVILLLLGAAASASLLFASGAPMRDVGLLMVVAGAAQVAHALWVETSGRALPWVASGALHALAGVLAAWPPLAAPAHGLLLPLALALAGASRLLAWRSVRFEAGSGWMLGAGLVTVLASLLALGALRLGVPGAAAVILAADLALQGMAWLALGLEFDDGPPVGAGGRADA